MAKTVFDLKNTVVKKKNLPFSSVFVFKQAKEQSLFQVQPLKTKNKNKNMWLIFG